MSSFSERAEKAIAEAELANDGLGTQEDWSDDSASEDGDGDATEEDTGYQLGFPEPGVNELFHDSNWADWDGGKIGGKPVWLDPVNLPTSSSLECNQCQQPLKFVLQIYCPLDDITDAFHRSLYIFTCKNKACVDHGNVCCLRNQLARENDYYPYDSKQKIQQISYEPSPLCQLCGCHGAYSCQKCKKEHYCSKAHQRMHWKIHKNICSKSDTTVESNGEKEEIEMEMEMDIGLDMKTVPALYPEYDLIVEPEVLVKDSSAAVESSTTIWEDAHTKGGQDEKEDLNLRQKDYDEALGTNERDPEYLKFLSRVRRGGSEQVLRYGRWEAHFEALPISIEAKTKYEPPICENCGCERKFEFQIMPQLLHFLHVDESTKISSPDADTARQAVAMNEHQNLADVMKNKGEEDIEWGTLDVYTCTGSCSSSSGYKREHVRIVKGVGL
jgi:pre-rRNA-processing protein TSR4